MTQLLLVVVIGFAAIYFSKLASASLVSSVLLPFLAFACLVYLLLALTGVTVRRKSSSGDCGGGDGGGGD
jgi:hypothetical protein